MAGTIEKKYHELKYAEGLNKAEFSSKRVLEVLPIALFLIFTFFLALPFTRSATMWLLTENRPVEILTFVLLMVSAFYGAKVTFRSFKQGETFYITAFYVIFSLGLFLTGMEEIAWGQQFWGFETPESLKNLNEQGEVTFHNIRGLHGNTEVIRLIFGIGGLIGIYLGKYEIFRKISVPTILFTLFAVITAHAAADVFDDIVTVHKYIDAAISELAELIELFIAAAAVLYLYINLNRFFQKEDNS